MILLSSEAALCECSVRPSVCTLCVFWTATDHTGDCGVVVNIHDNSMCGVILDGCFALNSMVMVILTSDLSMTFKLRSEVTKGHVEFKAILYVFRGEEVENRYRFDLWPLYDL